MIGKIADLMACGLGFGYTELRELPLDELFVVIENVNRINEARKKEMKK